MIRGGFAVNHRANMNYALYVSATSIGVDSVDSELHVGGRLGFFFPGPRLEIGGSFQRTLQDDRKNAFGFHMGWQPTKLPLSVREARSLAVRREPSGAAPARPAAPLGVEGVRKMYGEITALRDATAGFEPGTPGKK